MLSVTWRKEAKFKTGLLRKYLCNWCRDFAKLFTNSNLSDIFYLQRITFPTVKYSFAHAEKRLNFSKVFRKNTNFSNRQYLFQGIKNSKFNHFSNYILFSLWEKHYFNIFERIKLNKRQKLRYSTFLMISAKGQISDCLSQIFTKTEQFANFCKVKSLLQFERRRNILSFAIVPYVCLFPAYHLEGSSSFVISLLSGCPSFLCIICLKLNSPDC